MPKKITPSVEDYLETIYVLDEGQGVRSTDIALRLGLSKPSVSRALGNLCEMGFICREHYALVYLTDEGRQKARKILFRHTTIREFLGSLLGLSPEQADEEACKIEHAMSDETVRRIAALIESLKTKGEPGEREQGKAKETEKAE